MIEPPRPARHPFTDPVSGRECTLVIDQGRPWHDGGVGAEHPGCDRLAAVHPELDAVWCGACQFNGRVSGAWVMDMAMVPRSAPVEDSPVRCDVCLQRMPLALVADHLVVAHGVDRRDIADAEEVDDT
jgi:hypothetical protein